jgi:hypothetical protein
MSQDVLFCTRLQVASRAPAGVFRHMVVPTGTSCPAARQVQGIGTGTVRVCAAAVPLRSGRSTSERSIREASRRACVMDPA